MWMITSVRIQKVSILGVATKTTTKIKLYLFTTLK